MRIKLLFLFECRQGVRHSFEARRIISHSRVFSRHRYRALWVKNGRPCAISRAKFIQQGRGPRRGNDGISDPKQQRSRKQAKVCYASICAHPMMHFNNCPLTVDGLSPVHRNACTHWCTHSCKHTDAHAHIHTHTHTHTHAHPHTRAHTHTHTHTHTHARTHTRTHTHARAHTRAHTHAHTHTHTHTHSATALWYISIST